MYFECRNKLWLSLLLCRGAPRKPHSAFPNVVADPLYELRWFLHYIAHWRLRSLARPCWAGRSSTPCRLCLARQDQHLMEAKLHDAD